VGRRAIVLLAVTAAAALRCAHVQAASTDPRLSAVKDFAFAIGDHTLDGDIAARYRGYDLVIVDGQSATPAQVATLRAGGAVVLAYLSVGTIEPFRPWYRRLKPYRLPDKFVEFGEYYARLNSRGFRRQIAGRIAPRILAKGFDGLFLDNTDMVETHGRQKKGLVRLVAALSRLVDTSPGRRYLFAQNGADVIGPTLRFYDGWNREDVTWTYDFNHRDYRHQSAGDVASAQGELRRIGAEGLLTLATDYTAAGDLAASQASVADACAAGAVPFVSDIGLTRIPSPPLGCP
jgi:hypothetical protein